MRVAPSPMLYAAKVFSSFNCIYKLVPIRHNLPPGIPAFNCPLIISLTFKTVKVDSTDFNWKVDRQSAGSADIIEMSGAKFKLSKGQCMAHSVSGRKVAASFANCLSGLLG